MKHIVSFLGFALIISIICAIYDIKYQYHSLSNIGYVLCVDNSSSLTLQERQILFDKAIAIEKQINTSYIWHVIFGNTASIVPNFPYTKEQENNTNIEEALSLSCSLLLQSKVKIRRIALFTDGNFSAISPQLLQKLKEHSIEVYTYTLPPRQDWHLHQVKAPSTVLSGTKATLQLYYTCTHDMDMTISISANNRTPFIQKIHCLATSSPALITIQSEECHYDKTYSGLLHWNITAQGDARTENNNATACTDVILPQPFYLITNHYNDSFVSMCKQNQIPYEIYNWQTYAKKIPKNDVLYILDSPTEQELKQATNSIEHSIEQKHTLFCVNFPPCNYSWLPATIKQLPKQEQNKQQKQENTISKQNENSTPTSFKMKTASVLFLIDRSGSMEGVKLTLAKQAVIEALRKLWKQDSAGVLAFNDSQNWVVPLARGVDMNWAIQRVQSIKAEGSTKMLEALQKAKETLVQTKSSMKHIVFLTDGYDDSGILIKRAMARIAKQLRQNGITLTSIGIGREYDSSLLAEIAQHSQGNVYNATEYTEIPIVVIRDIDRILKVIRPNDTKKEEIQEKPVKDITIAEAKSNKQEESVYTTHPTPLLQEWDTFPNIEILQQIIANKNTTIELHTSNKTAPLLVIQYPQVNFSDSSYISSIIALWNAKLDQWNEWAEYPHFWKNLITYFNQQQNYLHVQYLPQTRTEQPIIIQVNKSNIELSVFNHLKKMPIYELSANKWFSKIPLPALQNWSDITIQAKQQENNIYTHNTAFFYPATSPELQNLQLQQESIDKIHNYTNGHALPNEAFFSQSAEMKEYSLKTLFLLIAVCLSFLLCFFKTH